jgi:hypothetical protein
MEKLREDDDDIEVEQMEEVQDVMFKVLIQKAQPEEVKVSKKNMCTVTIVQGENLSNEDEGENMLQYFLDVREPSWGQQFRNAVMLGPSIDQDNLIVDHVTLTEGLFHFACIFWKLAFACIPPRKMCGGWLAFGIALTMIGTITAIVAAVAGLFGCTMGLPASINAITLVALGTSLPDTFASMTAARTSKYADSAVGNITGSNSVNVFLGLGLPWVIATMYFTGVPN